jgi:hypothetical protein
MAQQETPSIDSLLQRVDLFSLLNQEEYNSKKQERNIKHFAHSTQKKPRRFPLIRKNNSITALDAARLVTLTTS